MDAPEKVKRYALVELDAHQTCIDAGPTGACASCYDKMMEAFDHYYGTTDPEDLRLKIAADLYGGR